jgi:hypothetical protein
MADGAELLPLRYFLTPFSLAGNCAHYQKGVPTLTSMGSGTAGAITGVATRMGSTGLSSEEVPTR